MGHGPAQQGFFNLVVQVMEARENSSPCMKGENLPVAVFVDQVVFHYAASDVVNPVKGSPGSHR